MAKQKGEALSITAIILTRDEEIHLARCIDSIAGLVARIIVVDSFSSDATVAIARARGAEVLTRRFVHQADQFQWALDTVPIASDWVLRLDADEYLEPALAKEIADRLPTLPNEITGVVFKRKVFFRGRWIRWGGYYPTYLLRLWRAGAARVEQRFMDEHVVLKHGQTTVFAHDFVDHNLKDITSWTEKHNSYATRQMVDFLNLEYRFFLVDRALGQGPGAQARLKRFLRNRVFAHAPLYLRGLLYFFQRYFVRLGFLDGREGFVFHFLQGLWNWILIDAKIDEARQFIAQHGVEAFKAHLKSRHGIDLAATAPVSEIDAK